MPGKGEIWRFQWRDFPSCSPALWPYSTARAIFDLRLLFRFRRTGNQAMTNELKEPGLTEPESNSPADTAAWKEIVAKYQQPSLGRALWQIVNTIVPYGLLWYLMYLSLSVSYWLTIPLAALAGAFLVRVFIIFHDCGHGSFLKSRR